MVSLPLNQPVQKAPWQTAMTNAVTCPEILLSLLALDNKFLNPAKKAAALFGLRVPYSFIQRMEKGNPRDPLLLQILPLEAELKKTVHFVPDPLQEKKYNLLPGLLHKYHGRVLITLSGVCGVNCRFCFRREFPYENNNPGKKGWDKILDYISANPTIFEVILSGGDPLMVPDQMLKSFCDQLLRIPHITHLRIHSRMPIVLPERITDEFVAYFKNFPLKKVLVLHTNHPNEINQDVATAVSKLQQANMLLLNQSVLLKNINNCAHTLIALSKKLSTLSVLPYYLHLLDKVSGIAHFEIPEKTAQKLLKKLQENLPGYLVPKLVREVPEKKHKLLIPSL
jgi:EF-P beta-lysylation protein EpmB